MRLVLDTNVVLSGLFWRSHPRRLLDLAKEQALTLYTSSALLDELADVLLREKWTAMLATRQTNAAYLMQRYGVLATMVRPMPIGRVVPDDPDDDAVIACALTAQGDLIVSGDKHLLNLGGQFRVSPSPRRLRRCNSSADERWAADAANITSAATR